MRASRVALRARTLRWYVWLRFSRRYGAMVDRSYFAVSAPGLKRARPAT
jgi:hypothetical protein